MASGGIFPLIHTVTLDESDCLVLCRDSFTPCERISASNWIGGQVNHGAGLDNSQKKKNVCPCSETNIDSWLLRL